MTITTINTGGRLGNYFIRNMAASILAKKYDMYAIYGYNEDFDNLNIILYKGNKKYNNTIKISSASYINHFNNIDIIHDGLWFDDYYQTHEVCLLIKKYFDENHRAHFNNKNPYYYNVNNNNDLFIHVRLGDIKDMNLNLKFTYYDNILSNIKYDKGYISSDTPNDPIVLELINKYNLFLFDKPINETILFDSTCKNIILSHGTFSWMIAFLSNNSNIYYPIEQSAWCPNIYPFNNWIGIK